MGIERFLMRPIGCVRHSWSEEQLRAAREGGEKIEGEIVLDGEYEPGLTDIEGFSHLYVIWVFGRSDGASLIAHPPGDDQPHGVFATRSPRRPNPLGLTLVELMGREGCTLHVRGLDMFEGTPVLDLKPCTTPIRREELRRGWLDEVCPLE
jgi:tRNA-Thr(GGU) m(6)t(6)A37 methyltransferase TsaA